MEDNLKKKFLAILLVVVLVFAMSSVAFAADVVSPEKDNTKVPVNSDPGTTFPQTGESFSVLWVVLAAVLMLGVAFFCGKKFVAAK